MIGRLVAWSLENRLIVVLLTLALVLLGVRSTMALTVDAVPDITNVQVQVLTSAPGLSPLEVEQLVSRPVELAMSGLPGTQMIRSTSRSGVSQVTIVFFDDIELASARTLVSQRLAAAREAIPDSAKRPDMGPLSTGLGEVYHFTVAWPGHTPAEIRTLLDWEIAYPLKTVAGVVEVNAWGGDTRQVEVRLRMHDLRALGITQLDVERALLSGGQNAGAGAIERGEEQVLLRFDGQYKKVSDVAEQVIGTRKGGVAIRVRDVATVKDGVAFRTAAATADGKGETVYAMVQMVAGGNASDIVARAKLKIAEINKRLPDGARIEPLYDRAALVDRVLGTVKRSLLEGGIIVVVVLFLFLGDLRAGIVVATAIPLAMLGAFALMHWLGMSGNLMSLGAIDFGLVVDGAVVVVEGTLATMAMERVDPKEAIAYVGHTVGRPIAFGVFIIGFVYVPVLLLEGVEGKMFRPMAWTVLFAIGMALVLSFTWIPTVASLLLRNEPAGPERAEGAEEVDHVFVIRHVRRFYRPILAWMIGRPLVASLVGLVLLAIGVVAAMTRGAEFVPRLEEGDFVVQVTRPPSVSLTEAIEGTRSIEAVLSQFPEVRRVVSRTGSPNVATDIMGVEMSDVFIILAPRSEWKSAKGREELVALFNTQLRKVLPGTAFSFTQPIEMRANELLGGMKSDLGIKVHGDDIAVLTRLAAEVAHAVGSVQGAADIKVEPTQGLPLATIRPNPSKMGRLGVRADEVRAAVEALKAGRTVGILVEGERRFDVTVRLDVPPSPDVVTLAALPIPFSDGRTVPLGDVCDISIDEGPAQISREQARRRVLVEANVRGRDVASFVQEMNRAIAKISFPSGYYVSLSGQYENLVRAATRFAIIVPVTLGVIFMLLYLTFGQARPAVLIFLNVPVAASGGFVALAARDLPFSISAAVGFIALFGVATLNGVVLLSSIQAHEQQGKEPREAAMRAAHERLRPVLTTAVVAALGFLPMAIATGTGAEVQRPLATVVMGGLVTATLLTLGLLPTLYSWVAKRA
jgi:cobalt-zinc-cadmium resistance protein CzcA